MRAALRNFGKVPTWFRSHMVLGIVGPALIIFHSNFHAHSLNASVALFFMLTIVASGIIGRYLFAKSTWAFTAPRPRSGGCLPTPIS